MAAAAGNATEMMDARKAIAIFMDAPRCRRASARRERSIALFVRSIESGAPNSPSEQRPCGYRRRCLKYPPTFLALLATMSAIGT